MISKHSVGGALAALALSLAAGSALAAPPPAASFGRREAIQSASISPDGQKIALVSGPAFERSLNISTIDNDKPVVLSLGDVRTSGVRWAGNDYVLVTITRYEKPVGMKYAYNLTRDLIFDKTGKLKGWLLDNSPESGLSTGLPIQKIINGDKPVAFVEGLAANMASATNNTRFKEDHASLVQVLWKVDVASGHGTIADRSEAIDFAIDADGDLRGKLDPVGNVNLITQRSEEQAYTVFGRGKGQMSWKAMASVKGRDVSLLGYSAPDDSLYWTAEDGPNGISQIHKVSFKDGATSIVPAPEGAVDVSMTFDPDTDTPLAMTFSKGSGEEKQWLDPKFAAADKALSKAFKGKTVDIVDWSLDRTRFIIRVWDMDAPAAWYLFDPGRKEVSLLGDEYPELKDQPLATKTYYTYAARDGLKIPAYLHLPPNSTGKNLPLVVFPHGGPASRDYDEFDWWAQFMASRGYAVLQPQFRGSDGFGYDFRYAGKQEWAGKSQLDVVDGVNDLAAKGVIDPKRVCIVGASYGGYSALYGMTSLPEVYKCGVSVNGVTDAGSFILERTRRYGDDPQMAETFGDNRAEVAKGSPLQNAAKARGPILLVVSAEDTTVPPEQSQLMAERLKQAGKDVTVVQLKGDDHHMMTSASRIDTLNAIDAFLAKNLPVTQ